MNSIQSVNRESAYKIAIQLRKLGHSKEADTLVNAGGDKMRGHLAKVYERLYKSVDTESSPQPMDDFHGPLSERQLLILSVYKSFKGQYRLDTFSTLKVGKEEKQLLANMGYLKINKIGRSQLTTKGKEVSEFYRE